MSHPAHKIVGPLLRTTDPKTGAKRKIATPEEVSHALTWPQAACPTVVHDEWVNEARRKNGLKGTSEIAGQKFRADQELRRKPKPPKPTWAQERQRRNWLQRLARRITRLFSRH